MNGLSLALVAMLGTVAPAGAQPQLFDGEGYRTSRYRSVVDRPPPGVTQIGSRDVAAFVDRGAALLIDVLPAEGGHYDPTTGDWALAEPHRSIAGAHWFPEVGRGNVDPRVGRWFMAEVTRLARERPRATVIVFCLADCWMSWNAALRLSRAGVKNVRWYAEGTDGWRELGRPLVETQPFGPVGQ